MTRRSLSSSTRVRFRLAAFMLIAARIACEAQPCPMPTNIYPVDEINTAQSELGPTWDKNSGETNGTFYFERGPSWYLDTVGHLLYQVSITTPWISMDTAVWHFGVAAVPLELPGLPAARFEAAPAMIPGGGGTQLLYCAAADLANIASGSRNRSDIFLYERKNGAFEQQDPHGTIELLRINSDTAWESHPAAAHNVIFFASNRRGGRGGIDIWYIVRTGQNSWSQPIDAWDINSAYDDVCPYLPPNNARTLYFSSNRPRPDGKAYGFDIYAAHRAFTAGEGSVLDTPLVYSSVELMPCVNTPSNELFFAAIDSSRGFYASDAPRTKWGGQVNFDLYQVIPNPVPPCCISETRVAVTDRCDPQHRPAKSEFEIVDITNGKDVVVARGKVNDVTGLADIAFLNDYRGNDGRFIARSIAGDNWFNVAVRIFPGRTPQVDSIPLWPLQYQNGCALHIPLVVQFQGGSSILQHDDTARLLQLVDQLNKYMKDMPPELPVRIGVDGHTDDRPTTYRGIDAAGRVMTGPSDLPHNQLLSDDRARHVKEFIATRLIKPSQVTYQVAGHSYAEPAVPYIGIGEPRLTVVREQNRRVEILVRVGNGK